MKRGEGLRYTDGWPGASGAMQIPSKGRRRQAEQLLHPRIHPVGVVQRVEPRPIPDWLVKRKIL